DLVADLLDSVPSPLEQSLGGFDPHALEVSPGSLARHRLESAVQVTWAHPGLRGQALEGNRLGETPLEPILDPGNLGVTMAAAPLENGEGLLRRRPEIQEKRLRGL